MVRTLLHHAPVLPCPRSRRSVALLALALASCPAAPAAARGWVAPARAERASGGLALADLERFAREPAVRSSRFDVLRDPRQAFRRRIELVDGARSSLVGTVYAIDLDRYGFAFLDALVRAARRGVKVSVGVDRIAQFAYDLRATHAERRAFKEKVRLLEEAGGAIGWYGGPAIQLRRPGSGVHYKTLVADGREAIVDGRNIGHEYVERWSDFGADLRGPIVGEIGREALRLLGRCRPSRGLRLDLGGARRQRFSSLLQEIARDVTAAEAARRRERGAGPRFALVAWDPLGDEKTFWPKRNRITEALAYAVDHARREVTLSSNFVHGGKRLREALIAAARRGVRVRLVTTGEIASEVSMLPYLITSAHYGRLVAAGCEIYETTRMEHGKMYVIDGQVAAFGSYNTSKVSDGRNAEGLLFSSDPRVVTAVRSALEETIARRGVRYVPRPIRTLGDALRRAVQWPLRLLTL